MLWLGWLSANISWFWLCSSCSSIIGASLDELGAMDSSPPRRILEGRTVRPVVLQDTR